MIDANGAATGRASASQEAPKPHASLVTIAVYNRGRYMRILGNKQIQKRLEELLGNGYATELPREKFLI
jgi:hypothetical protein